jgi:hypothetical protein
MLVARAKPLAILRDALDDAAAHRGRLVLVRGEPGIGKSALVEVVAAEAEERGFTTVMGRAWELAEAPPYFPMWALLRSLGLQAPDDPAGAFRMWEDVLARLAERGRQAPLLCVVEDVHAADLQTLDLLTFLVQPLRGLRALVVVTARSQDPRIGERAHQRLVRMAREGVEIQLEPLTPAEVAELAGATAGRPLSEAASRDLVALTGGNPLFVVECARVLGTSGAAPSRSIISLPPTVRQVVMERVDLLPEGTCRVLRAAAVLGREAAAATIARMLGTLPANVIDAMNPAIDGGIVIERAPGHFAFSHILVRDAIEDAIAPIERVRLHGSAEAVLASMGDAPDVIVERARHALAAMRPDGDAISVALRAADLLERLGAFDRALAMHERIEDARRAGLGPAADPDARLHVARVAQAAGRHAIARQICDEVLAQARANGDAVTLARAALVLGAELRPAIIDEALVSALEEARALTNDGPVDLRCLVLARLAAARQPAPDPRTPIAMAKEAIAQARAAGGDALLLEVLHTALAALIDYMPADERMPLEAELLDRALRADDVPKAIRAQFLLAVDQAAAGDFDAWEASVDRALWLSLQIGHPRHRWRALLLASMRALMHGDVALSDRYLVEVQQFATLTDDPAVLFCLRAHVGEAAHHLHRDEDITAALAALARHTQIAAGPPWVNAVLMAELHARLEDAPKAAELAVPLRGDPLLLLSETFSARLASALAVAADAQGCARMRERFAPLAHRHLVAGHVPVTYDGPVSRLLALLDSALGDHARAIDQLRDALAGAVRHGHRPWIAQIRYDLGKTLQRIGEREQAALELEAAAAVAEEVGMPGLVLRARRAAAPAAVPSHSVSADARGRLALTMAREGDAWRIEHGTRTLRVKDTRGMQLLARLVERPGEEIHVLVLASDEVGSSLQDSPAGEAVDARARRQYKDRLVELDEEIAEAERHADRGRLEKLAQERATLRTEVERAFGIGGRARNAGSASERARVNVQRRLKDAIARIAEHDKDLGGFLDRAVRTGTYCRFFL